MEKINEQENHLFPHGFDVFVFEIIIKVFNFDKNLKNKYMKKRLLFFLCVVLLSAGQMRGQIWNLTPTMTASLDSEGTLTISTTKEDGEAMPDFGDARPGFDSNLIPWVSDRQSILSVVIENKVTTIGNNAFNGCYNLSSVTIPESVTGIGVYAFANCWTLTSQSNVWIVKGSSGWTKKVIL